MRNGIMLLTVLMILSGGGQAQETTENLTGFRAALPVQGTVQLPDGTPARFAYHFNHNALKDCVQVGSSLIALSESGNLLRFDARTLTMNQQVIIPGCANAITVDSHDRVLIGTQEGQISEVDPGTLGLKLLATAEGRIVWLSARGSDEHQQGMIVAVVDNHTEASP
jgi:hypothetical protein